MLMFCSMLWKTLRIICVIFIVLFLNICMSLLTNVNNNKMYFGYILTLISNSVQPGNFN